MPSKSYNKNAVGSGRASRAALIGIDWGSTNLRSFLFDKSGALLDERTGAQGIAQIPQERLAESFQQAHADWLEAGALPVLMGGMAGSVGGFKKTGYLPCPAALDDLASALEPLELHHGLTAYIVPGLSGHSADGCPDVMRGEEIQILGALSRGADAETLFCLPGTHSKWAKVDAERKVQGFTTHLTGELFALLTRHSSLSRWTQGANEDLDAFDAGLDQAHGRSGLLHQLFGVRSRVLVGELPEPAVRSYLSGMLIGTEVKAMLATLIPQSPVHLIGDPKLMQLYERALQQTGYPSRCSSSASTAADGLYRIAKLANLLAP